MRYIGKKLGVLLVTLLVITALAFFAFQVIPGDPTTKMLGTQATPERVAELRAELGLDENLFLRYGNWLKGALTGDLGMSYNYSMPVQELLQGKVAITAVLSGMAFLLVLLISFPVSFLLARYDGRLFARLGVWINQIVMSVPPFFAGILFTYIFGLVLKLFTPGDFVSFGEDPWGFFVYLFFPALAIALPKSAMTVKMLRGGMLEQLREDYVRTAYSRGNSRKTVLRTHVLRNAMMPVITFLAVALADIVAGSIIIEQVFTVPGLGRLLLTAISNRDYPVVQAIVVLIAGVVLVVNFLADVIYQFVDPRVRIS
jgi:peptide/nickel transport system permease protein